MSTNEERIARMHERAGEIKQQRTKRLLKIEGAVTGALGVFMIALVVIIGVTPFGIGATTVGAGFAGASMLSAVVGRYVIVYVVAFLFGVSLFALIKTYREKRRQDQQTV